MIYGIWRIGDGSPISTADTLPHAKAEARRNASGTPHQASRYLITDGAGEPLCEAEYRGRGTRMKWEDRP